MNRINILLLAILFATSCTAQKKNKAKNNLKNSTTTETFTSTKPDTKIGAKIPTFGVLKADLNLIIKEFKDNHLIHEID